MTKKQNELITNNLNLVHKLIVSCINTDFYNDYEDLYQTGCVALCHAAISYDPNRGASFPTFANTVIRNELINYCRHMNSRKSVSYLSTFPEMENELIDERAEKTTYQVEDETISLLDRIRPEYTGAAKKGIEALILKCKGFSGTDIADFYKVKPNLVGAWISVASRKLRKDRRIISIYK